ncbi:DUF6247 family protein [Streptosporangium sp. NBC_01639]|uniref:DUF6247 family protein n=1 Tax=Streptosporangium sp. NBC_01639 TaxID=2975948 RepID=UPI003865CA54
MRSGLYAQVRHVAGAGLCSLLGSTGRSRRHGSPTHAASEPAIERTFAAVCAALPPPVDAAAFDAELTRITHAPVVNLAALDDFLTSWWRIATRAAQNREDWQRMHDEAEQIRSGQRSSGTPLAEILTRREGRI